MDRSKLYNFFADYVKKHAGITYSEKNYFQLDTRLDSIKKYFEISSDEELLKIFQSRISSEMHMMLIDIATNNETYFFRDPKVFQVLEKRIFPSLLKNKKQLSIWSLACSTGQEPYSILMTWDKVPNRQPTQLQIQASDISPRVLKKAQEGIYSQLEVQRGLPVVDLMKYFKSEGENTWSIRSDFKKMIQFGEFNLLTSPYPKNRFDIVFIRNVLIYQEVPKRKEIIEKVSQSLMPGGYLILGNSENLLGITDKFSTEIVDGVTVFQLNKDQQVVAA